jgi:hypothetical protein
MSLDNEDMDLEFVRSKRRELIDKLTASGVPGDIKEQSVLLSALKDMDSAALGRKKLKQDSGIGNAVAEAVTAVTALFSNPNIRNFSKFGAETGRSEIPELPEDIQPSTLVEGELSRGVSTDNFESLMQRASTAHLSKDKQT